MDESKKPAYAIGFAIAITLLFTLPVGPPFAAIIAGFFPLFLTVIIGLAFFQLRRPIPNQVALGVPLLLAVFLGLLSATSDTTIFGQLETWYLALANILGGIGVMAIMTDFMLPSPLTSTPSHLKQHIEEAVRYTYAINEAIKKVYTHQVGATQQVRNKLFLSTKLADKLEKMFAKQNYEQAHHIVYQVYEQLRRLFETEATLLGHIHLKNLNRDHHGRSRIVDVLIDNTDHAVRQYIEFLTHTLQNLNRELLGLRKN